MLVYYLDLAWRSLKRDKVLTALMVLALGLGIGACITTLTVLKLLSGDPLPQKSSRLFHPQMDPTRARGQTVGNGTPAPMTSYVDAMNLLRANRGVRQAAMALTQAKITPSNVGQHPYFTDATMTTADFFAMFNTSFQYGSGWTAKDDEDRSQVAVIAEVLNQKLFAGANSVGKVIRVNDQDLRIVGVLRHWAPQPRFYAVELGGHSYGDGDGLFLPLQTGMAAKMIPGNLDCWASGDLEDLATAPCMWLGFWVELDSPAKAGAYQSFLSNYVQQQIALGRFQHPEVKLPNLMQWLDDRKVVPGDVRLQVGMAFGFLAICIVNTVGLLLAKCLRRSREVGVRRALGATASAIFAQFMAEASMIGLGGGVLGLAFTELGLLAIRHQPAEYASLAYLDGPMFLLTFAAAMVSSLMAGIVPAWRACLLAPAPQLKAV